jgi:FAD dependent oxidoreductase TIGR03364
MLIQEMEEATYDLAVVGGGILGLAHAYHAARRGLRVAVFEGSPEAQGASIRNFGLIWPIGQSATNYALAMRSREIWLDILRASGLYHRPSGSLHLTYREDEAEVGREFAREGPKLGFDCEWLDRKQVPSKSLAVREDGLLGALSSPTEIMVDPRQVLYELPHFLAAELKVGFHYGAIVSAIELPRLYVGSKRYRAPRAVICPGNELNSLYSDQLSGLGLKVCKLQMLRTPAQPRSWQLGPALAGGLTLRFYPSFQICSSLSCLRERISRETPHFDRWGIHTMVSQGADGSLTFGDSHEYGDTPSPFLRTDIEELILGHISSYLAVPDMRVAERWYGVYAKDPQQPYSQLQPEPGVTIVTGPGGAGMTLSFAIAQRVIDTIL